MKKIILVLLISGLAATTAYGGNLLSSDGNSGAMRNNALWMLASTTNITQGQTSHFGSADFFTVNNDQTDDVQYESHEHRFLETLRQGEFLDEGSVVIEAPIDIVLNWGPTPHDLDSHLTGPSESGRFHVFYNNHGHLNEAPNVLLYRDYTNHCPGGTNLPEQTRINVTQPGKYNFYVHDYSNRNKSSSTAMSNSGAVVSVHTAGDRNLPEGNNLGEKVTEYHIPTNREGTVWHTFELDTARNVIKEMSQFSSISSTGDVPFNN